MPNMRPSTTKDLGKSSVSFVHRQRFTVDYDYDVHFSREVFEPRNTLLREVLDRKDEGRRCRVLVCLDAGVAEAHPGLDRRIQEYFQRCPRTAELVAPPRVIPGGESAKSDWQVVEKLVADIGTQRLDRQSYILAIGGGSVLDVVGFVAALVHRGLRLIRMPTTVLAQNDAGVGVKNGMNGQGVKNFLGTFAPPFAVINDFSFLSTLDDDHWRGGIAEAFKVAIIKDAGFFEFLHRRAGRLDRRDQESMEELIRRCAVLHLDHIAGNGDPFEMGSARPLDFGHWSAHKLETLSNYRISHGLAVAAGIALDSYYACQQGYIGGSDLDCILAGITTSGLAVWFPEMELRDQDGNLSILEGLREFQEHLGGKLAVTLPRPLGSKCEVNNMNAGDIEAGIQYLRDYQ